MIYSTLYQGRLTEQEVGAVSFELSCDILVVGAGCAGIYCADSAKREGKDVILLELSENIGGMFVCGNVTGYYYGGEGGSYLEDDKKVHQDTVFVGNGHHADGWQVHLYKRLLEGGVRLFTSYSVLGIYREGGHVLGVRAFDGQRSVDIRSTFTVDATSDGHLVRLLPIEKRYGRPSDGRFVPYTIRGIYHTEGRLLACNADSGTMNHYDSDAFSLGTILAHANASEVLKKGDFVNLALHIGVREGLSFVGEDTVRYEDILYEKKHERILFYAYSDLDRHGSDRAIEEELFQNFWVISNLSTVTIPIGVPMGAVVPKGISGFVTAGRCLSCDTYAQSAIRMNRDMFRMGECIGLALAMATDSGIGFLEIDYEEYLNRIQARGAFDGGHAPGFYFDNTYNAYKKRMLSLGRTPDMRYSHYQGSDHVIIPISFGVEEHFEKLRTIEPGVAFWSCYRDKNREAICERLYRALDEADTDLYRFNLGIALGLCEDERALPILREIVERRDCVFFTENRRSNQLRSAIAVCLLGRLGKESDLPLLFDILSKEEIQRPMYHTLKPDYLYHGSSDQNFVYFSLLTHATVAIRKIYVRHALPLGELRERFLEIFRDGSRISFSTPTKPGEHAYEEISGFVRKMLSSLG